MDREDSPTLEFVDPGTENRDYSNRDEHNFERHQQFASGFSRLVQEQNEFESLQKFETPKIQIAHSKIG